MHHTIGACSNSHVSDQKRKSYIYAMVYVFTVQLIGQRTSMLHSLACGLALQTSVTQDC